MAAGISGATCATRLRQLQALRDQQTAKEARLESELAAEASELQRLQQSNDSNAAIAERELVELTAALQRSLQCEAELAAQFQEEELAAASAAERRAKVSAERDAVVRALYVSGEEFQQWENALREETCEKERLLQELHEQRQVAYLYEQRAAAAAAARSVLEKEVGVLRREAMCVEQRELAGRRVEVGQDQRLLRDAFRGFASASQAVQRERRCCERFQKCLLARQGYDVFVTWRWHSTVTARWRCSQKDTVRTFAFLVLHAWAVTVAELRWITRQTPAAWLLRQRWLLQRVFSWWSVGIELLIRLQCSPAVRRFGVLILRSWQEESAAAWWSRRVEVYCGRWHQRSLLRRSCQSWCGSVQALRRIRRRGKRLQCRSSLRRVRRVLRSWMACQETHVRSADIRNRQRHELLLSHWLKWRQCCARQRAYLRLQCNRQVGCLRRAFIGFSAHVDLAHAVKKLADRTHCCENMALVKRETFARWWRIAAPLRAIRSVTRRSISERLLFWRRWSIRANKMRRCEDGCKLSRVRMANLSRRTHLSRWIQRTRETRKHTILMGTIAERQLRALRRKVWHLWLSYWKVSIRERCVKLEDEVRKTLAGEESLKVELQTMRYQRAADELQRLSIVDELQHACADVAELTVDLREVQRVAQSLEEAAASERQVAIQHEKEASMFRARKELQDVQQAEQCAVLEDQFREALAAPAQLRMELRTCEQQTDAAENAEVEAKHLGMLLQRELENLHAMVPGCLRERGSRVVELRESVSTERNVVKVLEEELLEQRMALEARDTTLEQRRLEETSREISMLRSLC